MNQKTVVMVDVYSPSMRLARAFMDRGYGVVRVQSTAEVPPVYKGAFDRADFVNNIVYEGDFDSMIEAVAKHQPTAVLAGGELGVELADRISEALGLATNGTALSGARRNKFVQIEALKAAGLRGARQLLIPNEEELAAWHREIDGRVVVKPLRSAGNDGVFFCDTPEDSTAAYRAVLEQTTIFAERNEAAVAQEYLIGTEYVVNTVSRDGKHRATDLWKYIKMSANGVRDRQAGVHLVPADDPVRQELIDYAFAVLDALGILHGPAHLEVMMTQDGPCLVEVGSRICGADKAYYAMLAAGESQIEQTVDAFVDPERFLAQHQRPYRVQRHVGIAWLTSPVTGTLRSYPLLDQVRELESFNNVSINVQPGQQLPLTVNDLTEPMTIGLAHPVAAVVERDFTTLSYLDGPGFYEVEMAP
ncbi:ATP-grasp domain-containing protein [Streptomyces buecherae]|uniref:ATP-grasp domain-containing protein n=1 Tax=Streptomyces buecherae TaxID=2763006 RepID=UPI0033D84041